MQTHARSIDTPKNVSSLARRINVWRSRYLANNADTEAYRQWMDASVEWRQQYGTAHPMGISESWHRTK